MPSQFPWDLITAEMAEQATWRSQIPTWHPRNDGEDTSDDTATAEGDTAEQAASSTQEETNWPERYKNLQGEFTKATQTLADEQALLRHVEEKFPHLLADEEVEEEVDDEDETGDDAEQPVTKAEWQEFLRQQELAERARQFNRDLADIVGDRELSDYGRDAILARAQRGDIRNADDLRKAVDGWFEVVSPEQPKQRKKAPHVPAGGQVATDVKDFSKMTRDEVEQWMVERVRAADTQS